MRFAERRWSYNLILVKKKALAVYNHISGLFAETPGIMETESEIKL